MTTTRTESSGTAYETIGSPDIPETVDLSTLDESLRSIIENGPPADYTKSRSEAVYIVACDLRRFGWSDGTILGVLTEPMNVVVRPLDNPSIDAIVERRRGLSGNKLLSKRDFARSIFHALRANEPVGILVDQNSSADNGAFVPFFGIPACANLTFAKLAARSGADPWR